MTSWSPQPVDGFEVLDLFWEDGPESIYIKGHHDDETALRVCAQAAPSFKPGLISRTYGRYVTPNEEERGFLGGAARVFRTGFRGTRGAMAVTEIERAT